MTSGRAFFDERDQGTFAKFAEIEIGPDSFDPVLPASDDDILICSIESVRAYMRQSFATRNAAATPFRVFPAIINDITINAFASEHEGLHLCGINSGLYGGIFELAMFLFSHADVFAEIGNPALEDSPQIPAGSTLSFMIIDDLRNNEGRDIQSLAALIPECGERYEVAVYLTQIMLRFVWFHELYHCLNGHVGFLVQYVPRIRLNELDNGAQRAALVVKASGKLPCSVNSALQSLEYDADRTALWAAYSVQLEEQENIVGIAKLSKPMRLKLTLFAAFIMTYIFDSTEQRSEKSGSHPDSYSRLHNLIRTTATHLFDADATTKQTFQDVMREFRAVRRAVPSLVDPDKLLDDCGDAGFQKKIDRADANLEAVRDRFSRFGYK